MGQLVSRPRFYDPAALERLLSSRTNRSRAKLHESMFGGVIPGDRVGEAVHSGNLSKKLLVRAAAWDLWKSGGGERAERVRMSALIASHALPWKTEDEYGEAVGFAFDLVREHQPAGRDRPSAKRKADKKTYTSADLAASPSLRREVARDLEGGFKWYKNNTADGCTAGDFEVELKPSGRVVVRYKSKKSPRNPGGSVMSKSVSEFSKIEYSGPAGKAYPFVHVEGKVKHYGLDGKLAAEF